MAQRYSDGRPPRSQGYQPAGTGQSGGHNGHPGYGYQPGYQPGYPGAAGHAADPGYRGGHDRAAYGTTPAPGLGPNPGPNPGSNLGPNLGPNLGHGHHPNPLQHAYPQSDWGSSAQGSYSQNGPYEQPQPAVTAPGRVNAGPPQLTVSRAPHGGFDAPPGYGQPARAQGWAQGPFDSYDRPYGSDGYGGSEGYGAQDPAAQPGYEPWPSVASGATGDDPYWGQERAIAAQRGQEPARDSAPTYAPDYSPDYASDYSPEPGIAAAAATPRTARIMNFVGAALSVALIGGVALWSYRLMVRDVSGVPVIRALDEPMRVASDTPGGRQEAHQGLAVNAVAADGAATPLPRQIAVAPPPTQLRPEDTAAITPPPPASTAPIQQPVQQPVLVAEATPLTPAQPIAPTDLIPASAPGVSRSLVPPSRPAGLRGAAPLATTAPVLLAETTPLSGSTASAQTNDAMVEAALQDIVTRRATVPVNDIDASSLPPGTRLVQFGPFASAEEARQGWQALARQFPGMLDGRGRIIEQAAAGGRQFFRLRASGFDDEPSARRFCAVFESGGVSCIPTLIR